MRLDRLLTLGLFQPLQNLGLHARGARLPILMYHSISDDPESGADPYFKICTSTRRFAGQMEWLAAGGWRGVTLSEGLAALQKHGAERTGPASPLPKLVAITCDDGFRDFHTDAFPVLQRHGFSATMYLPTACIGEERKKFNARECLTWGEVGELDGAGVEFGSHTVTHPKLVELAWPAIETELRDSKSAIEQRLGRPVPGFAYPLAFPQASRTFAPRFRELLATVGYHSAVTTAIGRAGSADNVRQLPRLPVNSLDDRSLFEAKMRGAYDWLAGPQQLFKILKQARS